MLWSWGVWNLGSCTLRDSFVFLSSAEAVAVIGGFFYIQCMQADSVHAQDTLFDIATWVSRYTAQTVRMLHVNRECSLVSLYRG
jgi:hypothetical protein